MGSFFIFSVLIGLIMLTTHFYQKLHNKQPMKRIYRYFGWGGLTFIMLGLLIATLSPNQPISSNHTDQFTKRKSTVVGNNLLKHTNSAMTTDIKNDKSYHVGSNIAAGIYELSSPSGSGNIISSDGLIDIILTSPQLDNSAVDSNVTSYRAILPKGSSIKIMGFPSAHLEALKASPAISNGNLTAGEYRVGKDVLPGTYTVTLVAGGGTLRTADNQVNADLSPDTNKSMKITLEKGQLLILNIQTVSLQKS
ncbi:hypothetical protein WOSG25_020520 [Weissella oryzae SG25]|uniref:Uncharacterized protein n=1 Tax=Weissella oryzae (strain DSM 25784 / JCM 18191 / LMG 30913 / SG25) TaxID=1329250 RepID=A0A069CR92_WEIOS|nr:hypothetical protein [Weissella oryzae]GAK30255.1 hypothetical protein WOSG25_020520 [Weissella oryzae SG25]